MAEIDQDSDLSFRILGATTKTHSTCSKVEAKQVEETVVTCWNHRWKKASNSRSSRDVSESFNKISNHNKGRIQFGTIWQKEGQDNNQMAKQDQVEHKREAARTNARTEPEKAQAKTKEKLN